MNAVGRADRHAQAVRLGFIGLGWIGRQRLDAIARDERITVAALTDTSAEKLNAAALAYPQALGARDLDELLTAELDGVVIATPNGAHAAQALRCLERDVPVFCQKPLGTTYGSTVQVIEAARAANRLLGVDFCYRHVRGMSELKRRIGAGVLGEITSLDLVFHNAYGPDKQWCFDRSVAGGGCLLDLGVHQLDIALWLQDFPRAELISSARFTQGRPARGEDIEDQAYVELRQANGAIVRVTSSWYAQIGCDAVITARILGTKGGALWRNVDGSFYDFEMYACRGASRETLARGPDQWGPRALLDWVHGLTRGGSFDEAATNIARSAGLIDAVYAA
jgi:predicted dehydrogenase